MITEEKIAITIRDIMQDFERAFDALLPAMSEVWGFDPPNIRTIKHASYELYDRLWANTYGINGVSGINLARMVLYQYEIQAISQKISGGNHDMFKDEIQGLTK